jgi:hypothetical protein
MEKRRRSLSGGWKCCFWLATVFSNWLDTAGYRSGSIQGRWNGCSAQPVPSVRKVASADVRHFLPAGTRVITAHQREQALRDRRSALQQRPLW